MDPHHALPVLHAQRRNRAGFASAITESLANMTFYSMNVSRVASTIREALHEDDQYAALTGEPMPEHHQRTLRIELSYWMEYDDLLRRAAVPEGEYARFCGDLRVRAAQLDALLNVQQELLGSPLAAHYILAVDRITGGVATASPTRNPVRALVQLREDRQERMRLAHLTYRHVLRETFFDAGTTDLTFGLHHAGEDQAIYEDSTGEAYPAHAVRANELERALWQHLLTVHERGTKHHALSCRRLTPLARILERTLELEDDLLTTPLAAYYGRMLDDLEQAARRTDRTFTTEERP